MRGPSVEIEVEYDGDDIFDDADFDSFPPTDNSPGRIHFEQPPTTPPEPLQPSTNNQSPEKATTNPPDTRSPLQRFRTAPRKPLSVTDLISPAWCELQYYFNLSRHGRKPATPAMKRGSSVHKELEEQVYETVQVEVQTREDHWGLRIWNIIQGLRTLRVTGMTRELEVWAMIDGEVVNGVIDELSYTCTDPELEAQLRKSDSRDAKSKTQQQQPPQDQQTIAQFFASHRTHPSTQQNPPSTPTIYLTDIKTRTHPSLPRSASLRPTHMQLMLYRRLLTSLASDTVNATTLFARYALDPSAVFSDALLATLASVEYNLTSSADLSTVAPVSSAVTTVTELFHHNTLSLLWSLMISELQRTIPSPEAVSRVLAVEFRSAGSGEVMGKKTFPYLEDVQEAYTRDQMEWWKGRREARGVEVEEAFKCVRCEFAEGCEWRRERVEEAVGRSRGRRASGKYGVVVDG